MAEGHPDFRHFPKLKSGLFDGPGQPAINNTDEKRGTTEAAGQVGAPIEVVLHG
jgi:hypothetical protein